MTATSVVAATPSSTSAASINAKSSGSGSKSLSTGAIVGIVIGVVVGVALVAAAILFFIWRHRKQKQAADLEQTKHYQPYSFGEKDAIILPAGGSTTTAPSSTPTPIYMPHADTSRTPFEGEQSREDDYARDRFSASSLPDVMQERPLRIVNPDE